MAQSFFIEKQNNSYLENLMICHTVGKSPLFFFFLAKDKNMF